MTLASEELQSDMTNKQRGFNRVLFTRTGPLNRIAYKKLLAEFQSTRVLSASMLRTIATPARARLLETRSVDMRTWDRMNEVLSGLRE